MIITLERLKKRVNKSGSGADIIIDLKATEKWVWDKFAFLLPHIKTLEPRNVASFAKASLRECDHYAYPDSSVGSSRAQTPVETLSPPDILPGGVRRLQAEQ